MVDAAIVRKMIVVDLPVKVNTTGTLPEGLSIKKMEVLPQTVKVTAPPSVLKNVKEIFTKPIVVSDLKEDGTIAAELFLPDKVLSDTKNVEVKFSLERK